MSTREYNCLHFCLFVIFYVDTCLLLQHKKGEKAKPSLGIQLFSIQLFDFYKLQFVMSTTTAELSADEVAPFIVIVIVTLLFVSFLIWLLSNSLVVVRHAEVMIVERWGKYYTTLKPGLHWLWPFMDSPRQVKWRYSK